MNATAACTESGITITIDASNPTAADTHLLGAVNQWLIAQRAEAVTTDDDADFADCQVEHHPGHLLVNGIWRVCVGGIPSHLRPRSEADADDTCHIYACGNPERWAGLPGADGNPAPADTAFDNLRWAIPRVIADFVGSTEHALDAMSNQLPDLLRRERQGDFNTRADVLFLAAPEVKAVRQAADAAGGILRGFGVAPATLGWLIEVALCNVRTWRGLQPAPRIDMSRDTTTGTAAELASLRFDE